MAVAFRASANATTGAAAAQFLTIAAPAGMANGDTILAHIAVQGGSAVRVLAPSGWALVRQTNSTTNLSLLTYQRQRTTPEAATYTWVFDALRNACGAVRAYYNTTASSYCRVIIENGTNTASAVGHTTPDLAVPTDNRWMVCAFAAYVSDTWTPDAAQTERDDTNTVSGATDICLETADDALTAAGVATGTRTSTLDLGVAAVGCTHACVIAPMGATQAGGAGNAISILDDTLSANGVAFTMAELAISYPNDIENLKTTNMRQFYKVKVALTIGRAGGTATTTLSETMSCIFFDASLGLAWQASSQGSWNCNFGTKVGTGNEAGGKNGVWLCNGTASVPRGNLRIYDSWIENNLFASSGLTIAPGVAGTTSELHDTVLATHTGGTVNNIALGTSAAIQMSNIFNVRLSPVNAASDPTFSALTAFNVAAAKKIKLLASDKKACLTSTVADAFKIPGLDLSKSTPLTCDILFGSSAPNNWIFISPVWSQSGLPKFSASSSNLPTLANSTKEYWLYSVKCVDGAGAGVSGVPVRLTDTIGTVQVDTTTDANGEITFGSGLTANAVIVMDHYTVGSTYTQRHRGPFLAEVNMPTQTGYNSAYRSHYVKFNWGGHETITTTAGSFEDMNDVFQMAPIPGNPVIWSECQI